MNRTITAWIITLLCMGIAAQADVFKMGKGLTGLETAVVGNPGNKADDTGYGAVAYPYKMGKFEVTCAQYVEFLNAKAKSDPYGLYDDNVLESGWGFKLERSGEDGAYIYTLEPKYANKPIIKITFWDACRFCNWLHNGQKDGDTETGAYTLHGRMDDDKGTVLRNRGARWFIPSENEWYKSAYYDLSKPGAVKYWDYPTRSNSVPNRDFSGANSANLNTGTLLSPVTTEVGFFRKSDSAYGTFDQGGNVSEWTETVGFLGSKQNRCQRGGSFLLADEDLMASSRDYAPPTQPDRLVGFRIAGAVTDNKGRIIAAVGSGESPILKAKADLWASPGELRKKKMIGTGQYSLQGVESRTTPRFLADNPEFCATHPFDGVTVVVPLDPVWLAEQGMTGAATGDFDPLAWSKIPVPYTAVQDVVKDLKRISWGRLTDNFLWIRMLQAHRHSPDVNYSADFTNDAEWAAVEKNAALMARICRETNLKGFMLDTEQYSSFTSGEAFPMGKNTPELVRQRGRQWIKAVQAEFPAITIMIFFSWSSDAEEAGFLAGMRPFLNGVLDEIKEPARLIHGHENTFYFGQGPESRYTKEGVPGGRIQYQRVREFMKKWRVLSSDPKKYDKFVKPGMAAWVESAPWDMGSGSIGTKNTIWSNLPYALAYSDEYVWVWSEYTNYGEGFKSGNQTNPFMASLSNQTFNTGREAVTTFTEDFASDPLLRGWYFDFDMLDIGRKKDPAFVVPIFSADAVPYVWSKDERAVGIFGTWMTGPSGDKVAKLGPQRRRYVHPIQPLSRKKSFLANLDFRIDSFGSDPTNPMVLGLFNSDKLVNGQSVTLQIVTPEDVRIVVAGNGKSWISKLTVKGGLKAGMTYRLAFNYDGKSGFRAMVNNLVDSSLLGQVRGVIPGYVGVFQLDEIGAAQWDACSTSTPVEKAYRYRLERVTLKSK